MNQNLIERTTNIRWYQRPLHEYLLNTRGGRAIEVAHRRWGKDEIALDYAFKCANFVGEIPNARIGTYWHCLPEYAQARKAMWTAVNAHTGKRRIDEMFPMETRESTNETEMFIRFKTGSTWQLIGSDRYDSTVGAGPVSIVYSEWALANPSAWAYHRPMLEENNGTALFITTPRGRNHAKTMFDFAKSSDKWFAEVSDIEHTGALSQEQISESKAEYIALYGEDLGQAQFMQEYECSFNAAILGAFFAREMLVVRSEKRIVELEPNKRLPIHTAWDLGVSDSTAIWVFQIVPGGLHILDYYEASGVGLDHYVEWLEKRDYCGGIDYVPHDVVNQEWASGRRRIDVMRELKRKPRRVAKVSVQDGINAARQTIPLCKFDTKTEDRGISALEQYRRLWNDETKAFSLRPKHDWASNGADAFRYLALAWRDAAKLPKPKQPPKDKYRAKMRAQQTESTNWKTA